ncbi:MAG: MBL fold metallo-hydrolase [Candidatus Azambacteria bacterium]|nr:MBL fold metallo-hydrolase [Candidatus Azambacteria bacterium]
MNNQYPKLTFCGGAGAVTGACYLLETEHTKILVDCGMFQGSRFSEILNSDPFPFDPKEISAVLITHAHIDHTGRLPKLCKDGFHGNIYATMPTLDFTQALLIDSEHVIAMEAKHEGQEPFYVMKDVEKVFALTKPVEYGMFVHISDDIACKFYDAGHILGSSMIEIFITVGDKKTKIVFTGDLGNSPGPLLRDTHKEADADYVVIESAYGDRLHEGEGERKDTLEDIIEETVAAGGVLMIPAFATERTQELLYELNELVEHGRIPRVPVFIDSPLAIKITEIYKRYSAFYDDEALRLLKSGDEIFNFPGLKFTPTSDDSRYINSVPAPKIILAGSGMSHGGRIVYHEKLYLPDPKSTLLIIGYQIKGSLGRKLLDGEKKVRIHGSEVMVRARIRQISGYSAHADQQGLYRWVEPMRMSIKKIFVVQGEESASETFAQIIKDRLALDAVVPKVGDSFILE